MTFSRFHKISLIILTLSALNISALAFGTEEDLPADVPDEIRAKTPEGITADTPPDLTADLPDDFPPDAIFDDKMLLEGYTEKYLEEEKDILLARIKDDTLPPYQMAAAVRAFKEKYSLEVFNREKNIIIKILLRRLARTSSVFVQYWAVKMR